MVTVELQKIFQTTFSLDYEIKEDMKRSDIKEWDSINHLNLIVELEEHYGITFSMEEIENLDRVTKILTKIQNRTYLP